MKKLSIILAIIISFFMIDNVNAKTEEKQSTYYLNIYREFINDGYENLDDFDKAFEEFYSSYKTTYPYYMISFYDMGSYVYVSYFLFSEKPNFQYLVYNSGSTNSMIWTYSSIGTFNAIYEKDTFTISPSTSYSTMVSSFANSSPYATTNSYFSWNFLQTQSFSSNGYEYYKNKIYFIYDCNFDITKADDNANNSSRTNIDLYIDGYYYQAGDIVPSYKDTLYEEPQRTIDISSTLKNELGETVKINFSEFDKEKFIYLYNFNNQPGNENWHEITENDYEYSTLLNGTLYVKMIDREQFLLNGNTDAVVAVTYTFTDLLMYEDIIDTYNMSDYAEIEYRYYGKNPAMFYYSTYRYGQVPENTYCITGTDVYDCNILNIKEITSNFYYNRKAPLEDGTYDYIRNFAYEDSPTYSIKEYDHAVIEDLTKYPITHSEECPTCWTSNYYRSFVLDLSMYLKQENRGRYIYVYYSTDIYDKTIKTSQSSWDNDTNTNTKLENLTEETINPPTYEDSTEIKDYGIFNPFIELINKKFPIINQMGFIISTFSFEENDDIPDLTVDLSSMGIPGKITIIDIEAYKNCKEMLFFFEYFSICMIGIPKIWRNIKSSLGGDK